MDRKLTQKRLDYALHLFEGLSQREAYLKAGYSPRQSPATLDRNACELAKNTKIQARWEALRKKAEDESVANVLERRQILTEIARGRLGNFLTNLTREKLLSAALNEFKIVEVVLVGKEGDKEGSKVIKKTTTIKLKDAAQAIDLLNKMDKLYTDGASVFVDNRKLEIIVHNEEAKELLAEIVEGKPPHALDND